MKLQFLHVRDLCYIIEKIIETKPAEHILNVGNEEAVSVKDWVTLCYKCFQKTPSFAYVDKNIEQRNYFCFYNYEYYLDVQKQKQILPNTIPLAEGLQDAADRYSESNSEISKKDYIKYIDYNLT